MAAYTEAQMADNLMQERCKRFDFNAAPGTGDKEMTVSWDVAHNKTSEAAAFLGKYGTGDNYKANPATPTQLLTDPVVENEPYPGKWRVVRSWYDSQIPGKVFQTRRFGYLTTLLSDAAVNWSEALLVSGRDHLVWEVTAATAETPAVTQADDYCVLQWRNIAPGQGPVLAKELVSIATAGTGAWTPLGDADKFGSGWRILPATHETAQDGSAVLSVAFVKLGVTVVGYGNQGAEIETETVLERCTEDQLKARVEAIKDAGGVSDISPSRDPQTGICQIRYTKLNTNGAVVYYKVESEPGQFEYHKLAWEQAPTNINTDLNWSGENFPSPGVPSITHLLRRVASVRRNPQTARWSYHIVLMDGGAQIPTYPAAPLTTYRVLWLERRMWSILNNMYWDQKELTCWKHETLIFTTFTDANTWVGGATPSGPEYYVDGEPFWSPTAQPLPPREGAAFPRLVGVNKWLAQRRTVAWTTGYYPAEPT